MSENQLTIYEKHGIDEATWSAIGSSIFPGASDESMLLAYNYCKARSLDILKKPCHIVPMNVKNAKTGNYEWRDVIMPSIADHRITANRSGEYAGQDPPLFGEMVEMTIGKHKHTVPDFCTVTVYRMIQGQRMACSHTEYFEEACGTIKSGELNSMWTKRKRGQLAKCAEAGALRKAFPEELGGMITADEADEIMRDVTPEKKSLMRDEAINPFTEPVTESPVQKNEATQTTVAEPEGKQKKKRYSKDADLVSVAEKSTESGKPFFVVTLNNGIKNADITTFSTTIGNNLRELDSGTRINITYTESKGQLSLEEYKLLENTAREEIA